ncbi:MAG: cellulose biosynthesis cyclic di-GMP-binding regulatory protein BcsB [Candidatus Oceanisphaera merdipullorum]|nr:cellulose biosynthesis cyclic di-GMP-binding regulatory protein BcsB [Candidatus Oceanisphaera merdipullorum]
MKHLTALITLWLLGSTTTAYGALPDPALAEAGAASTTAVTATVDSAVAELAADSAVASRSAELTFSQLRPEHDKNLVLRGVNPEAFIEFSARSDELVSSAVLNLSFTPSPALIATQSQVKVYLNDEMMGVLPITEQELGRRNHVQIPLDARYIQDFNRIKLEFIGHYKNVCENPTHSSLWLDVGSDSSLSLQYQRLPLANDLAYFPEPFFDSRDNNTLLLPMVFAQSPALEQQRTAAVLASWFGAKAQWRGQQFPALLNELPSSHAVVFATNEQRPDFLQDYPVVDGPTIEMISHPNNPYVKLLLVLGRDSKDLDIAVRGIVRGNILFRGQTVSISEVSELQPRKPYDAPNWIRTDRPVSFNELITYPNQLQAEGLEPQPILLTMNLPPDLFMARDHGIAMDLKYRYTPPKTQDGSRLNVSLNNQLLRSYALKPQQQLGEALLQLQLLPSASGDDQLTIPGIKLGMSNQLRFNFEYANPVLGGSEEQCETYRQIPNEVVMDGSSTLDFSGYRHFIAMPNLRAFGNAGFPFSRLADLSQTLVVLEKNSTPAQLTTLFNTLGAIGADTGYPALGLSITDDWASHQERDVDLLMVGSIPEALRDDKNIHLLLDATESWVQTPARQSWRPELNPDELDNKPDQKTTVSSDGPIAAIIGFQSPFYEQRSVVALLADSPEGYRLLNQALDDEAQRAELSGSVAVIRDSGVRSLRVGSAYYVGYLPWWERIWYTLAPHPLVVAAFTAISVLFIALVLWRVLRSFSRRRLSGDE